MKIETHVPLTEAASQTVQFDTILSRWCNMWITTKCTPETFRMNDTISRQEFSKFINAFVSSTLSPPTSQSSVCIFTDAKLFDYTLASHITTACERGYMVWYKWAFMPRDVLTRWQLVAIVVRIFQWKLNESIKPWYDNYTKRAKEKWIVSSTIDFAWYATRRETLEMLYAASSMTIPEVTKNTIGYTQSYTIDDATYGTKTTVTVANGKRTMVTNSLPNHPTGTFPNQWNPNTIKAVNKTYTMTLLPVKNNSYVQWPQVQMPWVWIDWVFFEPQTAERVTCADGQSFNIEAIQPKVNLWLDNQNAHVQPDWSYHYHGISQWLLNAVDQWQDLVMVGFASDGHYMYYSKSWKYKPSYKLKSGTRSVSWTCTYRNKAWDVAWAYDGTFVTDREYIELLWNLDACNGTIIDGTYAYLVTDWYPYVSRCVYGNPDSSFLKGWPNWGVWWPPNGAPWWMLTPR